MSRLATTVSRSVSKLSARQRVWLRRIAIAAAAIPLYGAAVLALVVVTAASTAPDRVATSDEIAALATPNGPTTTVASRPVVTSPIVPSPTTVAPTTAPPETTAAPATTPPPTQQPTTGFVLAITIVYTEPGCEGSGPAGGCAVRPGVITLADPSGNGPASFSAVSSAGGDLRQFDVTVPVPTVRTTWNISADISYMGPCGPAPTPTSPRYQLVVEPDASVRLIGVGATGELRRPSPDDQRWVATIHPYRFDAPEPGCPPAG